MTIGDFINHVLAIDSPEEAARFYASKVDRGRQAGAEDPEGLARANIGWCFGEGMSKERRAMWREACGASHPVLGDMVEDPSPEEALRAGIAHGRRLRESTGGAS